MLRQIAPPVLWPACLVATAIAGEFQATLNTNSSGQFELRWPGAAGATYHVESSKDLHTWVALPGEVAGTGTILSQVVTAPFDRGFWRVVAFDSSAITPFITAQPIDQTVNVGSRATFAVEATGTAPFSYQWRMDDRALPDATAASFMTPAATTADNGASFSVTITNRAGNVTSRSATLTVTDGAAPTFLKSTLPPGGNYWTALTFGNGTWVACRNWDVPAYSTDNGKTWKAASSANFTAQPWSVIAYGAGKFVMIAGGEADWRDAYMSSSDGINWTAGRLPIAETWLTLGFANGMFVASAFVDSDKLIRSGDGINWTQVTIPESHHWNDVTYADNQWFILGTGPFEMVSVDNGASWTEYGWGQSGVFDGINIGHQTWTSVAYGNGIWVTMCNEGTYTGSDPTTLSDVYASSLDGVHWTKRASPLKGFKARSLAFGNGIFVATPQTGSMGLASANGLDWRQVPLPASGWWEDVEFGDGHFVAIQQGSANAAYTSE